MAYIGLANLHYAIMTTEETPTTPPVYGIPKRIVGINTMDITPEVEKTTLYGDNQALDTNINFKKCTIKIDTANLPLEDQAALLGHTYNSDTKVINVDSTDSAPNVAIMFDSNINGNKKWYTVFYKGKFGESGKNLKTRGESNEYDLHSIEGEFVFRTDINRIYSVKEAAASDTNIATSFYGTVGGGLT